MLIVEQGGPRARLTDPETSHMAAEGSNLPESQQAVLRMLGNVSRTDQEIADEWARMVARCGYPNFSGSRLRTARLELMRQGLIIDTGKRRPTRSGYLSTVWALKGPRHRDMLSSLTMIRELHAQIESPWRRERRSIHAKHRAVS